MEKMQSKFVFEMSLLLVWYSLKCQPWTMFFTCFIPFLLFVLRRCHSYHISNIILKYILATFFTVFTLKIASCMCKSNIEFYWHKICFLSVFFFFFKIATMFKLLVIQFIIELYARNDIFKFIRASFYLES